MTRSWFVLLLVPLLYVLAAVTWSEGLRGQFAVVRAWSPDRFARAVRRAGGPAAVRSGIALDAVFVVLFAAVAVPLLWHAGGPWGVPLVAASLDAWEAVVLARTLRTTPDQGRTRLLAVIAWSKILAYGLAVIALAAAFRAAPQ